MNNKNKLIARILAILLSILMLGSGLTVIISFIVQMIGA